MMDIDLIDDRSLNDAIYGHAMVSPVFLRRLADAWPVAFPCQVVAIQYGHQQAPERRAGVSLHIHPGLIYWLVEEPTELELAAGVLAGDPQPCPAPEDLVRAIQTAIVSMRTYEVEALGELSATMPPVSTETQLGALAVAQLRDGHAAGPDTLIMWLKVIHVRHNRSLNLLRRKLLERLSAITTETDEIPGYSQAVELAVRHIYGTFVIRELLDGFVAHAVRVAELSRSAIAMQDVPGGSPAVARARAYIDATYRQPIQLQHVAAAVGVSAPHLARIFRRETGQTVGEALMDLRLREARILLLDTDWPIRAVAADCGFGSAEHFHRSFSRHTGTTPGAYRRGNEGNP